MTSFGNFTKTAIAVAVALLIAGRLHAQSVPSLQAALGLTSDQYNTLVYVAEQTDPIPAESVPVVGNFWSALNPYFPPMPGNMGFPAWDLGGGYYLLDDLDTSAGGGFHAMDDSGPELPGGTGGGGGDYSYTNGYGFFYSIDTNLLWLEITNVSSGTVYANLHNATDYVYAIWSTTNFLTPWQVETEVFPTDGTPATNCLPFNFPAFGRPDLFLRAEDWTGVTENGNTTPDWWFWQYFGTTALSDTNLDPGGNTFLHDYTNHLDPNAILFSVDFTNFYVHALAAPGNVQISGGVPFYIAVLVNDANTADAVWQPYVSSNFVASLGPTNGNYFVRVGLKGFPSIATATWSVAAVSLYAASPQLTLTNPTSSTVYQSAMQVKGYASQPLNGVTFDVSNSAGLFANQPGFLTGQFYNTNLQAYTTDNFESSSLTLASGTNWVTLHASDWAGGTTTLVLTLVYVPNTNPPSLTLVWPLPGTPVSGTNLTLQAQVSDPAATVTATINGNSTPGLIEASGLVWVRNLVLTPGTNTITLTASNVLGSVTTTNFDVVENDVGLEIDPLPADELGQASVTVTGSIADPTNDTVVVNGVEATNLDGAGNWEADSVPVNPTGTAILDVQVYTGDPTLIAEQITSQPQPPMVVQTGYSGYVNNTYSFFYGSVWPNITANSINWAYDSGGSQAQDYSTPNDGGMVEQYFPSSESLAADGPGYAEPDLGADLDYFSVNTSYPDSIGDTVHFQRVSQTQFGIVPPGQVAAGTPLAYLVSVTGSEISDPTEDTYFSEIGSDEPVTTPEIIQLNGRPLVSTGVTNSDGTVTGVGLVVGVAGTQPVLFTLTSPGYPVTFNWPQAMDLGPEILDANTGTNLSAQTNTVIVGRQMNLVCQFANTNSYMTNFVMTNFQWTVPGYAISNCVVAPDKYQYQRDGRNQFSVKQLQRCILLGGWCKQPSDTMLGNSKRRLGDWQRNV